MKTLKSLTIKIGILLVAVLIVGCAADGQIPTMNQESKELAVKIIGRRIGAELQKMNSSITLEVYHISRDIAASGDLSIDNVIIKRLVKILADETGDPLLAADVEDLMALLKIKPSTIIQLEPDQLKLIVAAASGLASGIELQGGLDE